MFKIWLNLLGILIVIIYNVFHLPKVHYIFISAKTFEFIYICTTLYKNKTEFKGKTEEIYQHVLILMYLWR